MDRKMMLVPLLLAVLFCGCSGQQEPVRQPQQTIPVHQTMPPESTAPQETSPGIDYDGIPVETPCGTLYVPDAWDEPISTTMTLGDPMILTFWAGDTKLYDLTFSETAEGCIGAARTEEGEIYVGMTVHPLSAESDLLLSMQESVNILLEQLQLSEPEIAATAEPTELSIETEYGVLNYPAKWKHCLSTEQINEYMLEFRCCIPDRDPVLLFTVLLHSEDGDIISSITDENGVQTALSIWIAELELDENWTDAERDMIYAMQEDMNYLLDALQSGR